MIPCCMNCEFQLLLLYSNYKNWRRKFAMMNKEIETKTSFASFQLFIRRIIVFLMNSFYYYDFTLAKQQKRTFCFIFNLQVYSMQWWMVAPWKCRLGNCCYLFLSSATKSKGCDSYLFFFLFRLFQKSCVQLVWRNYTGSFRCIIIYFEWIVKWSEKQLWYYHNCPSVLNMQTSSD